MYLSVIIQEKTNQSVNRFGYNPDKFYIPDQIFEYSK